MKIKQNKAQTLIYGIFLIVIIAMFIGFVIFDLRKLPHDDNIILDNIVIYWIMKIICIVCAFVCILAEVYFVAQLLSKKHLIEICDEYFYDNSSAISLGKISWSDMGRVYIKGGFLNIELKNPDEYFGKKNFIQMKMIKGNLRLGYGHACISTQRFKKQEKEFYIEFSKRKMIE